MGREKPGWWRWKRGVRDVRILLSLGEPVAFAGSPLVVTSALETLTAGESAKQQNNPEPLY